MAAYYNENDPHAAAWLRELIKAGLITDGVVDERSIKDVRADDVVGFDRVHFFAGIGGWDYALNLAGWGDAPVWTGSCPCQPFSAAGKRQGAKDSRHLWPWFRHLIFRGRPPVAFGEQVASADGRAWLAGVRANLETLGYAVGSADLCAAGVPTELYEVQEMWQTEGEDEPDFHTDYRTVGPPNIRQRIWWVAVASGVGCAEARAGESATGSDGTAGNVVACRMAQPGQSSSRRHDRPGGNHAATGSVESQRAGEAAIELAGSSAVGRMEHPASNGRQQRRSESIRRSVAGGCGWSDFDILPCADGKARRVESGTFPLAHGLSGRVGALRGYGNAINPWVAAEFIQACIEAASH